jgi:hypothetical protein
MYALKLSFVLRYQMDVPRSVIVPLEKLVDINLAGEDIMDKVLSSVVDDDELMLELFGDFMHEYRDMAAHADIYWKDLMRFQEELVLVSVEA